MLPHTTMFTTTEMMNQTDQGSRFSEAIGNADAPAI